MKAIRSPFTPSAATDVLEHAAWRLSRGRRPSKAYAEERNPRAALRDALWRAIDLMPLGKHEECIDWVAARLGQEFATDLRMWRLLAQAFSSAKLT